VKVVDPLSEDWMTSTTYILDAIFNTLKTNPR
jgi:hypothetical protein